jgi:hypothetical protein
MAKALRSNHKPLPPIQGANGLVFSDVDKAEAFADSLELQCRPNVVDADPVHIEEIENQVRLILSRHDDNPITPASPSEIRKNHRIPEEEESARPRQHLEHSVEIVAAQSCRRFDCNFQCQPPSLPLSVPMEKTRQSFSSPSPGRTPNLPKVIAPSVFFQALERFSKKSFRPGWSK